MSTPVRSPSAPEVMLRASGLTVARGRRVLLEALDLEVGAGEVVHVAGENGCGKSSLLRVLAGDVAPRRGEIRRPATWAYVPERMALPDSLPAQRWLGMLGAADVDLPPELDRRCGALSKGQLQRVALTAALHRPGGLVILDEPWSGLDVTAREWLERGITGAAAGGAAVLFTDHGRTGGLAATTRLVIGDGAPRRERVVATPPPTAAVRIVLARGEERREHQVTTSERDAVLAGALSDGWGVERVEAID
ncbi:MAG: ATP-binding cassette domain-containing protein [Solirubrobacteraceae bacterium]|nr:ATP-binding cassette domain-containing protein [Solirubrobacteraceae bacterium]